jgi:hypothetical protein
LQPTTNSRLNLMHVPGKDKASQQLAEMAEEVVA